MTSKSYPSKILIVGKNQNFGQKSKFLARIEVLVKNQISAKNKSLVKNPNFSQKSKF